MLFLLTLMPLTWMHFAWNRYKDPHDEGNVPNPRNKLIYFLYQTSVKVSLLKATSMFYLLKSFIIFSRSGCLERIAQDNSLSGNNHNVSDMRYVRYDCKYSKT